MICNDFFRRFCNWGWI